MADPQPHATFSIPKKLESLLKEYPELRVDASKGKICCCLTGHEMPVREDAVLSYVKGKKFLKVQGQREFDFNQYKPHLVQNTKRGFERKLFCTLTLRHVTKRPADVERHVNGKRYQRALKRWEKCQETGEKFKPRVGKKYRGDPVPHQKDRDSNQGGAGEYWQTDSEGDAEDDDMNDLYPSDDFASVDEDEDEEEDKVNNFVDGDEVDEDSAMDDDEDSAMDDDDVLNGQSSHSKALKRKKPRELVGSKKKKRTK